MEAPTMRDFLREALKATQAYLRSGKTLDDFKAKHGIRGKTDGHHVILDYDQITVRWDEPFGYVCRGLVLDARTLDVVCFGLHKFFNAGEGHAAPIDWSTARVYEKLDGTMVNRWWSPRLERFVCSTRFQLPGDMETNTVQGGYSLTWADLVRRAGLLGDHPDEPAQPIGETWTFEVTSPYNRVVTRQTETRRALLAIRENDTLREHRPEVHADEPQPRTFAFSSAEEVAAFAETLDGTETEGFVVVDGEFNRQKVKGSSYVYLHRLKDGAGSVKNLILLAKKGEADEVLAHFPEYRPQFDTIKSTIADLVATHEEAYARHADAPTQKDFAIGVNALGLPAPHLLFNVRAGKAPTIADALFALDEPKFLRAVKPLVERAGLVVDEDGAA